MRFMTCCRACLPPPCIQYWRLILLAIIVFWGCFLGGAFIGDVPTLEIVPLVDPPSSQLNNKVIIVGAGVAGLYAGYILTHQGIDVEILEASSSFGGRVRELPAGDFIELPLDLGAEWIHVQPDILQNLILYEDEVITEETISFLPTTLSVYLRGAVRDRDIYHYLMKREFKFYNTTWYSYFADHIAPRFQEKIRLNSIVEVIDYSGDGVVVTTSDGMTYSGDKIIVTVPLTVLQEEEISFVPPLPLAVQDSFYEGEMQAGIKCFIEFSQRFYSDGTFGYGILVEQLEVDGEEFIFDAVFGKETDRHVLGYLAIRERADPFLEGITGNTAKDQSIVFERILKKLDDFFDGQASKYYVQHRVQVWSGEPWIEGAYTSGALPGNEAIRPGVDGVVFFAGEHLAPSDNEIGSVHGAAMSASLAVNAMHEAAL